MKMKRVLKKKNPENSFCFKISEVFSLTESYVVVVNEKYPFWLKDISKL
jgi:hypothetical protein